MEDVLVVLTARCGSERCFNKAIAEVDGKPLIVWLIERFNQLNVKLVLGTTKNKEDDILASIAKETNTLIYRHSNPDDVVSRIDTAFLSIYPEAKFIFRALGDCPFYATELMVRAVDVMRRFSADAFSWTLPPENLPVYGAREFPYSARGWAKIAKNATVREHIDDYYVRNRDQFTIVYHEPPDNIYIRPPTYRLEVDYPADIEFVKVIAREVGMLAPLPQIIEFLDDHPEVVDINKNCQEKTGPLVSYSHKQRREWFNKMKGKPIVDWNNLVWRPPDSKATPVFCDAGKCLLGYGFNGKLWTREGHQLNGPDRLACACKSGKIWHSPVARKLQM